MTDYTYPATGGPTFGERDALGIGNDAKIIRGVDFDPEFYSLVTSVNSKLNTQNPAFTGTMTGGTIDGGLY